MKLLQRLALALSFAALLAGTASCRTSAGGDDSAPAPTAAAPRQSDPHIRFVPAAPGDVPGVVQAAVAAAKDNHRKLIVYEGAKWCEPCRHFHEAVASGQLDATFPDVTLLEFDADADSARLVAAGYGSQYIPLFALPGKDGRAAGPKAEGGIKGDEVIPYLTKKLQNLLSQGS